MKITLPIYWTQEFKKKPDKKHLVWLNFYRNAHYIVLNNVKKHYHQIIKKIAKKQHFEVYRIHFKIFLKNTASDWPNVRSIIEKFALDWLVEHWILKEDNVKCLKWSTSQYFIDKENPRAEIYIEWI